MVGIGDGLFIHIPSGSPERVLRPAKVVGVKGGTYIAEFEDPELVLEAGQDVLVCYEKDRHFTQQPARVASVLDTEPRLVISFLTTGQPVSAESRECYRVSTVMSDLFVDLGSEKGCRLLDVSHAGFSIIAAGTYGIGEVLDVRLHYEGETFAGKACIQSMRDLSRGRRRFGLLALFDKQSGRDLQNGLRRMTVSIQRKQLRHLAGAR